MKRGTAAFREGQRLKMKAWRASLSDEKKAEIRAKQHRERNRPEVKARARETRRMRDVFRVESTREKRLAYHKDYYRRNKDKMRHQAYTQKFGISLADYERMLAEQNGLCAICGQSEEQRGRKRLNVDHCHATGKVRGLLCSHCNRAIGAFDDRPEHLEKAAAYLRERA